MEVTAFDLGSMTPVPSGEAWLSTPCGAFRSERVRDCWAEGESGGGHGNGGGVERGPGSELGKAPIPLQHILIHQHVLLHTLYDSTNMYYSTICSASLYFLLHKRHITHTTSHTHPILDLMWWYTLMPVLTNNASDLILSRAPTHPQQWHIKLSGGIHRS